MNTVLIRASLFAALLLPVLDASACKSVSAGTEKSYAGVINGKYKISMSLEWGENAVAGEYFYHSQLKNIALKGVMRPDGSIALDEVDRAKKVVARFNGTLTEDCSNITGHWLKVGSSEQLPFSVSGSPGTRRYYAAGAIDDDLVDANASKFVLAVKNGDKKTVASMMAYPVRAQVAGKKRGFRNAGEFIASYDAIFTPAYRQAVVNSNPRDMSSSWRGIMLGEAGEVWLNDKGMVKALNNP